MIQSLKFKCIAACLVVTGYLTCHDACAQQLIGGTPLETYSSGNPRGIHSSCQPVLAYPEDGDDRLYVLWQDYRNDYWTLYFKKSDDFGAGWSFTEKPVSTFPPSFDSFDPEMATSRSGELIHVVWESYDLDNDVAYIHYNRSDDYGNTWNVPYVIQQTDTGTGPLDVADPVVACDDSGGMVYLVWSTYEQYHDSVISLNRWRRHLHTCRSADGGASWTDMQPVNDNHVSDASGESYSHGQIVKCSSNGNRVYIAYMDNRKSESRLCPSVGYRKPPLPVNIFAHGPVGSLFDARADLENVDYLYSLSGRSGDGSQCGIQHEKQVNLNRRTCRQKTPPPVGAGLFGGGPFTPDNSFVLDPEPDPGYQVYFTCSTDAGVSYSPDTIVCHGKGEDCSYLDMKLDKNSGADDGLYISWTSNAKAKSMAYPFFSNIFLNRSDDGGETWWGQAGRPEIVRIDQDISGEILRVGSVQPRLAFHDDYLYCVFCLGERHVYHDAPSDYSRTRFTTYVRSSDSRGDQGTWADQVKIMEGPRTINPENAGKHYYPLSALDGQPDWTFLSLSTPEAACDETHACIVFRDCNKVEQGGEKCGYHNLYLSYKKHTGPAGAWSSPLQVNPNLSWIADSSNPAIAVSMDSTVPLPGQPTDWDFAVIWDDRLHWDRPHTLQIEGDGGKGAPDIYFNLLDIDE